MRARHTPRALLVVGVFAVSCTEPASPDAASPATPVAPPTTRSDSGKRTPPRNTFKQKSPGPSQKTQRQPGWVGLRYKNVDGKSAEELGLRSADGALIVRVTRGSPAEKAGLRRDDVIFAFNGKRIRDAGAFAELVREVGVGERAAVAVHRRGKVVETTLVPTRRP